MKRSGVPKRSLHRNLSATPEERTPSKAKEFLGRTKFRVGKNFLCIGHSFRRDVGVSPLYMRERLANSATYNNVKWGPGIQAVTLKWMLNS